MGKDKDLKQEKRIEMQQVDLLPSDFHLHVLAQS